MQTNTNKYRNIIIPVKEEHKTKLMEMVISGYNGLDTYLGELYSFYTYQSVASKFNLTKPEIHLLHYYCTDELTDSEICKKLNITNCFLSKCKESIFGKMNINNMHDIKLKLTIINTSAVLSINSYLDPVF